VLADAVPDRDLFEPETLSQEVEREHLGVVVVVYDLGPVRSLARERAHPRLAVGNVLAGEQHEQRRERVVPDPPVQAHPPHPAPEAAPEHVVGPAREHGLDEPRDVPGEYSRSASR
jgi:hypothetical protein